MRLIRGPLRAASAAMHKCLHGDTAGTAAVALFADCQRSVAADFAAAVQLEAAEAALTSAESGLNTSSCWLHAASPAELAEMLAVTGYFVVCEDHVLDVARRLAVCDTRGMTPADAAAMVAGADRWGLVQSGDHGVVRAALRVVGDWQTGAASSSAAETAAGRDGPRAALLSALTAVAAAYADCDAVPSDVDAAFARCVAGLPLAHRRPRDHVVEDGKSSPPGGSDRLLWHALSALPERRTLASPGDHSLPDVLSEAALRDAVSRWPVTVAAAVAAFPVLERPAKAVRRPPRGATVVVASPAAERDWRAVAKLYRWCVGAADLLWGRQRGAHPCWAALLERLCIDLPHMQLHGCVQIAEALIRATGGKDDGRPGRSKPDDDDAGLATARQPRLERRAAILALRRAGGLLHHDVLRSGESDDDVAVAQLVASITKSQPPGRPRHAVSLDTARFAARWLTAVARLAVCEEIASSDVSACHGAAQEGRHVVGAWHAVSNGELAAVTAVRAHAALSHQVRAELASLAELSGSRIEFVTRCLAHLGDGAER